MKASIQQRIAPPQMPTSAKYDTGAKEKANDDLAALDGTKSQNKTSFKEVMLNSMEKIRRKREAEGSKDFSDAKTDAEFLEKLSEASKPKPRTPKNNMDKDDFLKLFVAQLQHQDPLNPDDGAEMAAKLAQFNGLEQMMNMNTKLQKLLDGQSSTKSLELVNYVGKDVKMKGGRFKISNGAIAPTPFKSPVEAASAILRVHNTNGVLVSEKELGNLTRGDHNLEWDGIDKNGNKVKDGVYVYSIDVKTVDGKRLPLDISSNAVINGVDIQDKDGGLSTTLGKLEFKDVISIGAQSAAPVINKAVQKSKIPNKPETPQSPTTLNEEITRSQLNSKHPTPSAMDNTAKQQMGPNTIQTASPNKIIKPNKVNSIPNSNPPNNPSASISENTNIINPAANDLPSYNQTG